MKNSNFFISAQESLLLKYEGFSYGGFCYGGFFYGGSVMKASRRLATRHDEEDEEDDEDSK